MNRSPTWQQCAKLHRRIYWLHKGITFRLFVLSRTDQRYVSPRTPARLRDSISIDISMPVFQHSGESRGGSRFPGHVRYRSLHARARPFVTRFSRIGSNAIHEGWRVTGWPASRARYRSVRETCARPHVRTYRGNRYCFPGLFSYGIARNEFERCIRHSPRSRRCSSIARLTMRHRDLCPRALTSPRPASSCESIRATAENVGEKV